MTWMDCPLVTTRSEYCDNNGAIPVTELGSSVLYFISCSTDCNDFIVECMSLCGNLLPPRGLY